MSQQTKKSPHVPAEHDEPGAAPVAQPDAERISKDTADLLDEIDSVLAEHDAAKDADASSALSIDDLLADIDEVLRETPIETVTNYRQRGGQ